MDDHVGELWALVAHGSLDQPGPAVGSGQGLIARQRDRHEGDAPALGVAEADGQGVGAGEARTASSMTRRCSATSSGVGFVVQSVRPSGSMWV